MSDTGRLRSMTAAQKFFAGPVRRRARLAAWAALAAILLTCATSPAFSQSPPSILEGISPAGNQPNGPSTLSFTLSNPNTSTTLTGVAFTDNFPANLFVIAPLSNTCGGTLSATAGGSSVSLTGGTIAQASFCTITVNVSASLTGTYLNTTGAVSSDQATGGTASASLTVANPPTINNLFLPSSISATDTTLLSFTLTNPNSNSTPPNSDVDLTGVSFTDALPAGLVLAPNPIFSDNCGGTLTAAPGATSLSLTGGSIARAANESGGNCFISVLVTAKTAGNYNNTTSAITSDQSGPGATSNTTGLTVNAVSPPTISDSFGATSIAVGGSTTLSFSISNPNTVSLTGIGFTDTLPAGLAVSTANGLTNSRGGTATATPGSSSISLSGATLMSVPNVGLSIAKPPSGRGGTGLSVAKLPPGSSSIRTADDVGSPGNCTLTVNVTATSTGVKSNTTGPITSDATGPGAPSNTATITVNPPTVTSVSPNSGPTTGGTSVAITGTNFIGVTAVKFGSTAASSFTVNSAASITATSPAGTGIVDITVIVAGVSSPISPADQFTFTLPVPAVTSVSPNVGPVGGGTSVTVTGTNFTGATAVRFGATAASSFTVNSATSITATSPPGTGTVDLTVTTPGGTSATGPGDQFSYKVATTTSLSSSLNPSSFGQAVTFSAKVTGSSPSGTLTFLDGGTAIGSVTLAGGAASFTTSSLATGTHAITAKYGGDGTNLSSTSAVLVQTVNIPAASVRLHEMELLTMPMAAQIFGQAVTGAANAAIAAGFIGNPRPLTVGGNGFTYYFNADPEAQAVASSSSDDGVKRFLASPEGTGSRFDRDFNALAYAGPTKAPPKAPPQPRDWLAWIDVRATQFDRNVSPTNATNLFGNQVDVIAGITHRLAPDFLVGVLGGYEHFDFTSQALDSRLRGDAWTSGAYFGWRLTEHIRFDTTATWSDVAAGGSADAATGNFSGRRWLLASGLTGAYGWQSLEFQPSAQVYALWEHDNAFVDSLGTQQAANDFSTGRASGGLKVGRPLAWSPDLNIGPYVGLYGDYYFSRENTGAVGLTTVPLLQGWSARATGGLSMAFKNGATVNAGAELGGLGSDTHIWTFLARGNVPF